MKMRLRGWLTGALAGLILILPTLSGCGAAGPTTASGPVWGLPYKTGTSVTLGCLGLHDDNIFADSGYSFTNQKPQSGTPAFACPPPHVDDPTHANDASLDLLSAAVGVPVIALASGMVLIADESCHFVVVDHGNNTWVAYLHIDVLVTVHQQVTRDTVLGTTAVPHTSKCENSNAAHVHIAFINGSGHSGAYISMVGKVLCGFQVIKNAQYPIGALQEVAHPNHIIAPGTAFTVPNCPPAGEVLGASTTAGSAPIATVPPGIVTEFSLPSNSQPAFITSGSDGALWFADEGTGSIARLTTSGHLTEFPVSQTGSISIGGLAAGPDGNIWFGVCVEGGNGGCASGNYIASITPAGKITPFDDGYNPQYASGEGYNPHDLVTGPDGNVWFAEGSTGEANNDQIERITPQGHFTEYPVLAANTAIAGMAGGPDGNVWFTEKNYNSGSSTNPCDAKIGRITPDGHLTEFPVLPGALSSCPGAITAGPDGALWFADDGTNSIGRITTTGQVSEFTLPVHSDLGIDVVAGPDGALWFTASVGSVIGRITPAGNITDFPLKGDYPYPSEITVGPDGALWFLVSNSVMDTQNWQVGRITA